MRRGEQDVTISGIDFRLFDERTDTENVVCFYNDTFAPLRPFHSWPISVERFRDKVLGCWEYKREGFWLAEHAGRLAGFVLASCRTMPLAADDNPRQAAHVAVIAVDPEFRRRGIGRALCEKAEEFARGLGAPMITPTCNPMAPMAFFIAVQEDWKDAQAFFNAVGFDQTEGNRNFVQSLEGFRLSDAVQARMRDLESQGYECRTCEPRDFRSLIDLLGTNPWPFWALDMESKIGTWTRTRPFIETCFLDCSTDETFGPDEIGVVVKDGRVLSFCVQTLGRGKRWAYAGPVLTHPEARCLGLGWIATQLSLRRAAEKGAILADVWTGADAHHTHFYCKCGYVPMLRWLRFEKKLKTEEQR